VHGEGQQLILVLALRVQPECLAGSCASGSTTPLVGIGLRNGIDLQGVHADARIVDLQLAVAGIDDIDDAIDGQ